MSSSLPRSDRFRRWLVPIASIVGWLLLVGNAAEAEPGRVPDFVLAQVLGAEAPHPVPERAAPAAPEDTAQRVAAHLSRDLADQLVAGVHRPSVELEVHFDFDSDAIHEASSPQIEAAAEVLTRHFPDERFRVAGYTDAVGDADYNQTLSERRARAVWRALVETHGVAPERLDARGFGIDGSSEVSDAERRRVELQILRAGR